MEFLLIDRTKMDAPVNFIMTSPYIGHCIGAASVIIQNEEIADPATRYNKHRRQFAVVDKDDLKKVFCEITYYGES